MECEGFRACLDRWKPTIVCLQETKLDDINARTINEIWHQDEVGWASLSANGTAGGILVMWNKSLVDYCETLVGGTTVACKFVNLSNGVEWFFWEFTVELRNPIKSLCGKN